jgi:hypothetical protein
MIRRVTRKSNQRSKIKPHPSKCVYFKALSKTAQEETGSKLCKALSNDEVQPNELAVFPSALVKVV